MALSVDNNGSIRIGVSTTQMAYVEKTLEAIPGGAKTAIRAAINDTLRHARTHLTRQVGEVLNLRARDIRDRIGIAKRATGSDLVGVLRLDYKAAPLLDFRARFAKRSGVSATIFKADGVSIFKHQFSATMASGHVGIFQRIKDAPKVIPQSGSYAGKVVGGKRRVEGNRGRNGRTLRRVVREGQPVLRQPIKETFGTSVLRGFEEMQEKSFAYLGDYFKDRLASKVRWQLEKASIAEPPSSPE